MKFTNQHIPIPNIHNMSVPDSIIILQVLYHGSFLRHFSLMKISGIDHVNKIFLNSSVHSCELARLLINPQLEELEAASGV